MQQKYVGSQKEAKGGFVYYIKNYVDKLSIFRYPPGPCSNPVGKRR